MLDVTRDIRSLTEFKKNTPRFVELLRGGNRALVLTVNGRAELVALSAATFQGLMDRVERLEASHGIRRGLDDVDRGWTIPADQVLEGRGKGGGSGRVRRGRRG